MNKAIQKFFTYAALYLSSSADSVTAFKMAARRIEKHKQHHNYILEVIQKLENGQSITESFEVLKNKKYVNAISWALLSSTDTSGSMLAAFKNISEYMKASSKMKKAFISSLAYPVGVVFLALTMVYFLIAYIFPKITPMFVSLKATVPPTTAFLIFLSSVLKNYSSYIFGCLFFTIALFIFLYTTYSNVKYVSQGLLFHVPVLKSIVFAKESYIISFSCGVLLGGGKSLAEGLLLAGKVTSVAPITKCVNSISMSIESGKAFSQALIDLKTDKSINKNVSSLFQHEWVDLIHVGETSGNLPRSFIEISEFYENQMKEYLDMLAKVSEPAALAFSASIILIVALSVIQPMYEILNHVHP